MMEPMGTWKWKILLLAATLSLTTVQAHVRDGVYLGAGCGAGFGQFDLKAMNTLTGVSVKREASRVICQGNAFLGFGWTLPNCVYLGLETATRFPKISARLERPAVSVTKFNLTNVLSVREMASLDVVAGYRLARDYLLYGRIGGSFAKLHLQLNKKKAADVAQYDFNDYKSGLRAGVGANFEINCWMGVGLDYIYTGYRLQSTYIEKYKTNQTQRPHTHSIAASLFFNFS